MSIRPVDMQLSIHKSTETNRLNGQNEGNRPEVNQQQFAEKLQKETKQIDQQITKSDRSEKQSVDKDGRGSGGYATSKKKDNHKRQDEKEKRAKSSSMFDVSI